PQEGFWMSYQGVSSHCLYAKPLGHVGAKTSGRVERSADFAKAAKIGVAGFKSGPRLACVFGKIYAPASVDHQLIEVVQELQQAGIHREIESQRVTGRWK